MKSAARVVTLAVGTALVVATFLSAQISGPPPWAYGYHMAGADPAPPPCTPQSKPLDCARIGAPRPNDVVHKMPDTDRTFTEFQIHADYGPGDWYPQDHPAMPHI